MTNLMDMITKRFQNALVVNFLWIWWTTNWRLILILASEKPSEQNLVERVETYFNFHYKASQEWALVCCAASVILTFAIPLLKIVTSAFSAWLDLVTEDARAWGRSDPLGSWGAFKKISRKRRIQHAANFLANEMQNERDRKLIDFVVERVEAILRVSDEK